MKKFASVLLVLLLVMASSPVPVIAESGTASTTQETQEESSDTVIETGNATAGADVTNEVNTNATNTDGTDETDEPGDTEGDQTGTTTPEILGETGTSTPFETSTTTPDVDDEGASTTENGEGLLQEDIVPDASCEPIKEENASSTEAIDAESASTTEDAAGDTHTTCVENDNAATTTNGVGVNALTGENNASSTGNASITTGTSAAFANVINVLNTNIFNSYGLILLLNAIFGNQSLDLREFSSLWQAPEFQTTTLGGEQATSSCSLESCDGGDVELNIVNNNTATIYNDVIVRADSGGNAATSSGASARINTGDAYAGANVINVANTNLTNSNYLLVSLNNFGDLSGDIVLPGASFFNQFFGLLGGIANQFTVQNDNVADVSNSVSANADSGGNAATSTEDSASVATGKAVADANVVNQVNTNITGGSSVFILFRVHGDWSGTVQGLPEGVGWRETPYGVELFSSDGDDDLEELTASGGGTSALSVANTNDATIANNVGVYALTGDNQAVGAEASIETGNAYASANVLNIANTNVVGSNWIFAVFNIFGNWSGNISFGRPDLWIGGQAESSDPQLRAGSKIDYQFTIMNRGDSAATGVEFLAELDNPFLTFDSGITRSPGQHLFDIGTIPAGGSITLSYSATVDDEIPYGTTPITTTATVSSTETDENADDNTETLGVVINRALPEQYVEPEGNSDQKGPPGSHSNPTKVADLVVTKMRSGETQMTASSTVHYIISIVNHGDFAYDATLTDTLKNEAGEIISQQQWHLGDIYPDEEIEVSYDVFFNQDTEAGVYTNEAQITAHARYRDKNWYPVNADSNIARAQVVIVEELEGIGGAIVPQIVPQAIEDDTEEESVGTEAGTTSEEVSAVSGNERNPFDRARLLAGTLFSNTTFMQWFSLVLLLILLLLLIIAGRRIEERVSHSTTEEEEG